MLLTDKDRAYLDACDEDGTCAIGRMLSYLDQWEEEGIAEGRFTKEQAEADLEAALYRAFALLQDDRYLSYAQVVTTLEKARESATNSGVWHYRLACGLTHTGRLDEALKVAEEGVLAEPDYPWGWLHLGKLRAHFGDKVGALVAAAKGLDLVPDDPEFLQLQEEIEVGVPLPVMLCHYIDPESDAELQNLQMDLQPVLEKQLALTCLIKDPKGFEVVKNAFNIDGLQEEPDAPACLSAEVPFSVGLIHVVFRMNEAGFSHLAPTWVKHFKDALEEFLQDGHCQFEEIVEVWLDLDRTIHVVLKPEEEGGEGRVVRFKVNGGLSNESARPAYANASELTPEIRAMLDRVASLNEEEAYDEIIQMLEKIPDDDREPILTLELARAHNNASPALGPGLERAVALLQSVKDDFEKTYEWQFRMGYALFYLDRDDEALAYFQQAEALRKGDQDTLELMRACRQQMSYPRFVEPFAQRVESLWKTFEEKTTDWQKRLIKPEERPVVLNEMKQAIHQALPDTAVALGATDGVVEVNLSTDGNYLQLYLLRAMVRAMPDSLRGCWLMTLCRPAMPSCAELILKTGLREYAAKDLYIYESVGDNGSLCLTIYSKPFETLNEEEVEDAFRAVNLLLDHAFGEVARMQHFGNIRLSRKPEEGVGFSLPEYVRYVHKCAPQKLVDTVDDYLDDVLQFQWNLDTDDDCDYLLDAKHGQSSVMALISAYFNNEPDVMRLLHRAGATAGMLFVDSQDLDETSRAKLRDELRALLREKVPHAYESFGQIEGRKFAYELFFAWDLPAVLEVVNEFGEAHDDVVRLGFHSFFREAAGLMMKQPEDD